MQSPTCRLLHCIMTRRTWCWGRRWHFFSFPSVWLLILKVLSMFLMTADTPCDTCCITCLAAFHICKHGCSFLCIYTFYCWGFSVLLITGADFFYLFKVFVYQTQVCGVTLCQFQGCGAGVQLYKEDVFTFFSVIGWEAGDPKSNCIRKPFKSYFGLLTNFCLFVLIKICLVIQVLDPGNNGNY